MTTPYMNLLLPTVSVTAGPLYATEINAAFTSIDLHNHTTGLGVPVPSAGININADLSWGGYNITALRSTRYTSQLSALALAADLNCVYFSGGNFFVNDGSGNQIQLTTGGALNTASVGGISGLGATTASVVYSAISTTFTFTSAATVAAFMDCGAITIRDNVAVANGIKIQSPAALAGNYTLTLPTGLPASTSLLTIGNTGILAASLTPTVTSLTATTLSTGTLSATTVNVSSSAITSSASGLALGADAGVVFPNGSTGAGIYSGNTPRKLNVISGNGSGVTYPILVSAGAPTYGQLIVHGSVSAAGAPTSGEGWSVFSYSAGYLVITFTTDFASTPQVICSPGGSGTAVTVVVDSVTTHRANMYTANSSKVSIAGTEIHFMIIGQRGS